MSDPPLYDGIPHHSDAVGVGDHHGSFEKTGFFDPGRSRHFTVAVLGEPRREHGVGNGILASRQHRRHSRTNGPFSDQQLAAAGNQSRVTDRHARHIGDGIERPGVPSKGIPRSRARGFSGIVRAAGDAGPAGGGAAANDAAASDAPINGAAATAVRSRETRGNRRVESRKMFAPSTSGTSSRYCGAPIQQW